MLQCGMIIAFKYNQKQKQEIRKGGIVMMERKYSDRRKKRFDRRDSGFPLFKNLERMDFFSEI